MLTRPEKRLFLGACGRIGSREGALRKSIWQRQGGEKAPENSKTFSSRSRSRAKKAKVFVSGLSPEPSTGRESSGPRRAALRAPPPGAKIAGADSGGDLLQMTAEHPPSPETSLLEHDAAAQPTTLAQQTLQQTVQQVVAQQVQQAQHVQHAQHPSHAQVHQTHPQQVQVQQDHANGAIHAPQPRQKTPSSRRGKQYKCGQCGELGHNS